MTTLAPGEDYEVVRTLHPGAREFVCANYGKYARCSPRPLERALTLGSARCLVAHVAGHPDDLLGYVVVRDLAPLRQPAVWWAYTRRSLRRRRLAAQLLAMAGVDLSAPVLLMASTQEAQAYARQHKNVVLSSRIEGFEEHEREAACE